MSVMYCKMFPLYYAVQPIIGARKIYLLLILTVIMVICKCIVSTQSSGYILLLAIIMEITKETRMVPS